MKRVALFVGVDEYEDGSISDLEYAVDDAEALAAVFETLLGFERVERLRNPGGKKDILRKVREVTSGLGAGDLFFFFFAGHGFRVKDNHVLVCTEDEYRYLKNEDDGLRVGLLKDEARGPWNRMLVIDACQNDIRKSRGSDGGMSARDLSLILEDGRDGAVTGGEGVEVVVTSCSEGQKALEVGELGHGLFTSALLETVKDHARTRRRLDVAGFQAEMSERMAGLVRKYQLGGKQNPLFKVPGECRIVLLEGEEKRCAKCGRWRPWSEMYVCDRCGKPYCKEHRGAATSACPDCLEAERRAEEARREAERRETERKRQEEERRRQAEKAGEKAAEPAAAAPAEPAIPVPPVAAPPGPEGRPAGGFEPRAWRNRWFSASNLEVEWGWPEGAEAVRLLWRGDRTPVPPDDPSAKRATVRRKENEWTGRHFIEDCGNETRHFLAQALGKDGEALGDAVAFSATGPAKRWRIRYTLEKPQGEGGHAVVIIRGTGEGMAGLPAMMLRRKAGGVPLHPEDGELVRRIPACSSLTEVVKVMVEEPGVHLALFLDGENDGLAERVDFLVPGHAESRI